jgi:16S rRNA (cytidine1402-2'-O)-methyltransferase
MLYIVSTPIGNLEDITERAKRILAVSDYILCEDSRKSAILLNHLQIKKKLISFHKFCEKKEEEKIIQDLEQGKEIALISDGGTPLISDPGYLLVKRCIEKKIPLTAIPGPCSLIDALVLSGFNPKIFQFVGFLPKKKGELESTLRKILHYGGVSISFESPLRILSTLELINKLDPEREVAIARELTKIHEEVLRGTSEILINHFSQHAPRGEIILIFSEKETLFNDMPLDEMLFILKREYGLSSKEALKLAAKLRKEPKKSLYKQAGKS